MRLPELLAPAGNLDSAYAAINAGANALYLGGKDFSARSFAPNFNIDELKTIIEHASLKNVNIYIAVNTLYKDSELDKVMDFVSTMHQEGAKAFILQDIGLANAINTYMPGVEIHASTQMSVHSLEGVNFMEKLGFSRVILSRELSLEEITNITSQSSMECEVFVHGALCVSYSGECLMSSLIGGRSGNRGKCAGSCRLQYSLLKNGDAIKNSHLLSPKDMMTLEILPDIIKANVRALKIEGRMKTPEYVYVVTKAYRDQLDKIRDGITTVDEQTIENVTSIFNRGGSFSTGYYNTFAGTDMMSAATPKSTGILVGKVVQYQRGKCLIKFSHDMVPGDGIEIWTPQDSPNVGTGIEKIINKNQNAWIDIKGNIEVDNLVYRSYDKRLTDNTKKAIQMDTIKTLVQGDIEAKIGEPLKLSLHYKDIKVEKTGTPVEPAQKAPMAKEEIIKQLSKTGNTHLNINYNNVHIDDNIFIAKQNLNALRRDAIEELENKIIKSIKRDAVDLSTKKKVTAAKTPKPQTLSVQIRDIDKLYMVIGMGVPRVYINYSEYNIKTLPTFLNEEKNCEVFLALPNISRNDLEDKLKQTFLQLEQTNLDGYLVATYGQLNILFSIGTKKKIVLDHNFNVFNTSGLEFFEDELCGVTLSQELSLRDIRNLHLGTINYSEIIIYGRQTLMSTHNCPIGIYDGYKTKKYCTKKHHKETYALLDRKNMTFPILTDCDNCIAIIQNCKILDTSSRFDEIKTAPVDSFRLIFTTEGKQTIKSVINIYKGLLAGKGLVESNKNLDATHGHFFRGVE